MTTPLSTSSLIARQSLEALAESRLREARILFENGQYVASIYLAGLALECCLKVAICDSLDWDDLRRGFKFHDLEALLVYGGLDRRLRACGPILENFNKIRKLWAGGEVRYMPPEDYNKQVAEDFLTWIDDKEQGVVTWLRNSIR